MVFLIIDSELKVRLYDELDNFSRILCNEIIEPRCIIDNKDKKIFSVEKTIRSFHAYTVYKLFIFLNIFYENTEILLIEKKNMQNLF